MGDPSWDAEDLARASRIRQWEAAGAPVAAGTPDPLDRCFGPRNATPDQLVGEQLTVAEMARVLNMSPRAVSSLARKSYQLIESDLWDDMVSLVFDDLRDAQAELVEKIQDASGVTPQSAAVVAALEARYEAITSTLDEQCVASPAGKGWVNLNHQAREGRLSFLWQQVLLRGFPANPGNLKPPRDCPILLDPADPGLAFAIVDFGARGCGNARVFRRARVPCQVQEWRRPPNYVMGPRDLPRITC